MKSISNLSDSQLHNLWHELFYKLCSMPERDSKGNIIRPNGKIVWIKPTDVEGTRVRMKEISAELKRREKATRAYMREHPEEVNEIKTRRM